MRASKLMEPWSPLVRTVVWALATIAVMLLVWMAPQGAYGITRASGYTYNSDGTFLYPYLTYYYVDADGLPSYSATTHTRVEQMSPTGSESDRYDNSQSSNGGIIRDLHLTLHTGNEDANKLWLEYRVASKAGWSGWVRATQGSHATAPDGGDVTEIQIDVKGEVANRYSCVYNVHAFLNDTAHNGHVKSNTGTSANGGGIPVDGFHANISITEYPVTYSSSFSNGRAGTTLGTCKTTYRDRIGERYTDAPRGYAYQGSEGTGELCCGASDVTVRFAPISYTVAFDGNGATSGQTPPMGMTYDEAGAAPPCGFEREGYVFRGWATAPDEPASMSEGDELLNLSDKEGDTVTFWATWDLDMTKLSFSVPTTIPLRVLPSGEVVAPQSTYIENLSPWPIAIDATSVQPTQGAPITLASSVKEGDKDVMTLAYGLSGSLVDAAGATGETRLAKEDVVLGRAGAGDARVPLVWESTSAPLTDLAEPMSLCDVTWSVSPRPS